MKTSELIELLGTEHIRKLKGIYKVKRYFFYRGGSTTADFLQVIERKLKDANIGYEIISKGEQFHFTRKSDPHWWVEFKIKEVK